MRILSGVQSSGNLHLGNYYGAIRQFVELQHEGESLYFIADLHAMTTVREPEILRASVLETALAFLSLGLDPARAILFRQSDIPEIPELYWILGTVVPLSHLERATSFNVAFVPGYDPADPQGSAGHPPGILKLPQARIQESTAVVPGIDGQKMSKSYGNAIDLFASDAEIKKRIMSIKTDSTPVDVPKPTENSALYQLLKLLAPEGEFVQIDRSWKQGGTGYGDYKKRLLDLFHAQFDPARKKHQQLLEDQAEVERVLSSGAKRARQIAAPIIEEVRRATGLRR